jgi:hypothetical protein
LVSKINHYGGNIRAINAWKLVFKGQEESHLASKGVFNRSNTAFSKGMFCIKEMGVKVA